MSRLSLVGLTGGIGSGKSTVAEFFRSFHVKVEDADQMTRSIVLPDQPALKEIIQHFGKEILRADGSLDRDQLKSRIFKSDKERLWLENLLHPLVKKIILNLKKDIMPGEYRVVAIPLLVETHFESAVDRVLVVDCKPSQQIERVQKRDGLSFSDIQAIMKTQASQEDRLSKADDIIENEGSLEDLKSKVWALHQKYSLLTK